MERSWPAGAFKQGVVHKEYLEHLYELFKDYCLSEPKISKDNSIRFHTRSLQCFNEFYDLFYFEGKKAVPLNIGELLTSVGLAYWIQDDGTYSQKNGTVTLCTEHLPAKIAPSNDGAARPGRCSNSAKAE